MSKITVLAKDFIAGALATALVAGNAQDTQSPSFEQMNVGVPLRGCSSDHREVILRTQIIAAGTFNREDAYRAIEKSARALSLRFKIAVRQITAQEYEETAKLDKGAVDNAMTRFLIDDMVSERETFKAALEKLTHILQISRNFTIVGGAISMEPTPDCLKRVRGELTAQTPGPDNV